MMFKDADEYLLKVHKGADIPECSEKTFTIADIKKAFNHARIGHFDIAMVVQTVNGFRQGYQSNAQEEMYKDLLEMKDKWCK